MDNLTIIIIVLSVVFVVASLLFFYPKIKAQLKSKKTKDKKTVKEEKPEKPNKKVKRPIILTGNPNSSSERQLSPPPVPSADTQRQQQRPNFENYKPIERDSSIDLDNIRSFVDTGERPVDITRRSMAENTMVRNRASRYNRDIPSVENDEFHGISMDDLDIDGNNVSIRNDDTFSRAKREREDDLFNEFKNLSPEMKKILLANIIDKKDDRK